MGTAGELGLVPADKEGTRRGPMVAARRDGRVGRVVQWHTKVRRGHHDKLPRGRRVGRSGQLRPTLLVGPHVAGLGGPTDHRDGVRPVIRLGDQRVRQEPHLLDEGVPGGPPIKVPEELVGPRACSPPARLLPLPCRRPAGHVGHVRDLPDGDGVPLVPAKVGRHRGWPDERDGTAPRGPQGHDASG